MVVLCIAYSSQRNNQGNISSTYNSVKFNEFEGLNFQLSVTQKSAKKAVYTAD